MRLSRLRHLLLPSCLCLFAFALRRFYFCGFILGDDAQEFHLLLHILNFGPDFADQLHLRLGVWVLNYPFVKLLGLTETAFFLPTWIISSAFAAAAYALLVRWGYGSLRALVGGLAVATAPFEILTGTLRMNDLFLAAAMVAGLLALAFLDRRPFLQGTGLAACLGFGLYVKVWALYLAPPLLLSYLVRLRAPGGWRSPAAFLAASLLLHGALGWYWHSAIGTPVPFIVHHPPTTPIPPQDLDTLLLVYPSLLLRGSDVGTTLFGAIPYVWLGLLVLKATASLAPDGRLKALGPDAVDLGLLTLTLSFFLLLNFFPTSFTFDRYYSIPRIFRYLAPLSFPMTLHVAKMLCDASRIARPPIGRLGAGTLTIGLFAPLIASNLLLADEATRPGRLYRQTLLAFVDDVRRADPPRVVAEAWLSGFLRSVYLKEYGGRIVDIPRTVNSAKEYEAWLRREQDTMPAGTVLLTGFGGYLFYGAVHDGFRLTLFSDSLSPRWKLVRDYGLLTFLPRPEPARLWALAEAGQPGSVAVAADPAPPETPDDELLYRRGLAAFDRGDCADARLALAPVMARASPRAVDARYLHAVCAYRAGEWERTVTEFGGLLRDHPDSQWTAAAHWHIGMAFAAMRDDAAARRHFDYVIERFPNDTPLVTLSRQRLATLPAPDRNWVDRLTDLLRAPGGGDRSRRPERRPQPSRW